MVHGSKHLTSALESNNNTFIIDITGDTCSFELATTKDVIFDVEKNHRGKGENGGGSIARKPFTQTLHK